MHCSCNKFSYERAGAEMKAEFLYKHLIVAEIVN